VEVCKDTPYNAVPGFAATTHPPATPEVEAQFHPDDRYVRMSVHGEFEAIDDQSPWAMWNGTRPALDPLTRHLKQRDQLLVRIDLEHGNYQQKSEPVEKAISQADYQADLQNSKEAWRKYWQASSVSLSDQYLEQVWYHNLYFTRCTIHPEGIFPGLYGNWVCRRAGSVWHGDYHMNYNTQQPTWGLFATNHVDLHGNYVQLVEDHLTLAQKHAREYFELPGAAFPHNSYPIPLEHIAPAMPDMGWEMCETPWWVQSLWWHYEYSGDVHYLRERAWPSLREATRFICAYMSRPDAGPGAHSDDRYHIYPTVPPELYCHTPGLKQNIDCLADLTLTKFLLQSYLKAVDLLNLSEEESELAKLVQDILANYPEFETAGEGDESVYVGVVNEDPNIVYNCPISTMSIFPGEEHGVATAIKDPEVYERLKRTYAKQYNEGGNDLVHLHMQATRLGILDIEKFKRQINYCMLPNGSCTDMVMHAGGRYGNLTEFNFMQDLGIWVENFALSGVITECLMQSWDGTIRLFPNWDTTQPASFTQLRAKGAFLISAACAEGQVTEFKILSERGGIIEVINPWDDQQVKAICTMTKQKIVLEGASLQWETQANETWELQPE